MGHFRQLFQKPLFFRLFQKPTLRITPLHCACNRQCKFEKSKKLGTLRPTSKIFSRRAQHSLHKTLSRRLTIFCGPQRQKGEIGAWVCVVWGSLRRMEPSQVLYTSAKQALRKLVIEDVKKVNTNCCKKGISVIWIYMSPFEMK